MPKSGLSLLCVLTIHCPLTLVNFSVSYITDLKPFRFWIATVIATFFFSLDGVSSCMTKSVNIITSICEVLEICHL